MSREDLFHFERQIVMLAQIGDCCALVDALDSSIGSSKLRVRLAFLFCFGEITCKCQPGPLSWHAQGEGLETSKHELVN